MPSETIPTWVGEQLREHADLVVDLKSLTPRITAVARRMCEVFDAGGTVWTFGNGGSAADAQHLTGELIGHYKRDRRPLACVTLSTDPTVMTCISNDYDYDDCFARQVEALAKPEDMVCGFTTSGTSPNVVSALRVARRHGASTVLFGGKDGGDALQHADLALIAPSRTTARIQEMHTLMLHLISEWVDRWAAGEPIGDDDA